MPHYQFMYGNRENEIRIQKWITAKIDATHRKNRGGRVSRTVLERLEDLNISDFDIYPNRFVIYSTDVDASVAFNLNPATGHISVSFSDSYGGKAGEPWWCLAVDRPESRTCTALVTADAPYDISILEYIRRNLVVQTGPVRAMRRRVTVRRPNSSPRSSNSNRSSSSTRRRRMHAEIDNRAANLIGSTGATRSYSSPAATSSEKPQGFVGFSKMWKHNPITAAIHRGLANASRRRRRP